MRMSTLEMAKWNALMSVNVSVAAPRGIPPAARAPSFAARQRGAVGAAVGLGAPGTSVKGELDLVAGLRDEPVVRVVVPIRGGLVARPCNDRVVRLGFVRARVRVLARAFS